MSLSVRPRITRRELTAIVFLCAAFLLLNAWWVWRFRLGQPLDIDEAGYFSRSFRDFRALQTGGLPAWIGAIETGGMQAPLTPALSSLLYLAGGPSIFAGFFVPMLAGAVTVAATFSIGKSVGSTRLGILSALLVASSPALIDYSRDYTFAAPVTAITAIALLALIRSRRLRIRGWAYVFGVFLGLMPLARTMAIAFVPGLLAAAAIQVAIDDRRAQLSRRFFSVVLVAVLVSATWLMHSGRDVIRYLVGYGYGMHSTEFGERQSLLSPASWLETARNIAGTMFLPGFAILIAGAAIVLFMEARTAREIGIKSTARKILSSPMLPLVALVIGGLCALTSSGNKGSGFVLPLVPPMFVLACWAFLKLTNGKDLIVAIVGYFATVLWLTMVALSPPLALPWQATLPALGAITISDGRGNIQLYELAGGFSGRNPLMPVDPVDGRRWLRTIAIVSDDVGMRRPVAFGFRHRLLNGNAMDVERLLSGKIDIAHAMVDPIVYGNSIDAYVRWLTTGDAAASCVLATADDRRGQFPPAVTSRLMEAAALRAGFTRFRSHRLPDGASVTVWRRADERCRLNGEH